MDVTRWARISRRVSRDHVNKIDDNCGLQKSSKMDNQTFPGLTWMASKILARKLDLNATQKGALDKIQNMVL